ncbi:nucleus protein [Rhizoctonia solani AG-3 Rhs1AP]|uniref:Nucleus protein n=1 Tax=Rhizoctonia solani AG-3 Rhs1AP TaxID=1086054 RepID=X8JR13_9AGAM|nr:nucleus protein [Rhizoctonia solani AG-3 Rhs1AP]
MVDSIKVLVVGSALGSITSLFEKVSAIDKKHGKFSVLLCTGDFFGGPSPPEGAPDEVTLLLDGKITAPMTTYITQGKHELPPKVLAKVAETGGEICPNVIFLGKAGVMNITNKIRVGCLGGILDIEKFTQTTEDPSSPYINQATVKAFTNHPLLAAPGSDNSLASAKVASSGIIETSYVDILITHLWPPSIARLSNNIAPILNVSGKQLDSTAWSAPPLDALTLACKPRYHFASAGGSPTPFFWEREPFIWDGDSQRVARFVNLGAFGENGMPLEAGAKKPRWFYAFSIAPTDAAAPQARPANATPSPFYVPPSKGGKRAADEDMSSTASFVWGSNPQGAEQAKRPRTDEHGGSQKPLPAGYKCKHCSEENTHWGSDCPNKVEERPPPGYKCNRCNSSEHYVRHCPSIPEGYVCKKCGGTDHFIRNCPNANAAKRPPETYSCRACGSSEHYFKDCPQAAPRQGAAKEIGPDECWFCLSNPAVTKHLIVSIGSECYVTLPKGQLIPTHPSGKAPLVPGGGHLLIIPIAHYPTLLSAPPELAISIIAEVEQYKSALRNLFSKHGAAAVMFEVARLSGRGGHAHIQVVPVPLEKADRVEGIFQNNAQREGIKWEQDAEAALEGAKRGGGNYFRVDLPDGRKMISLIRGPFNLQFGRTTLAELLGLPERADWKACAEDDAQQRTDAAKFKKAFASFDPVLQ